jgi:hypothetical protein
MTGIFGAAPSNFTAPVSVAASAETARSSRGGRGGRSAGGVGRACSRSAAPVVLSFFFRFDASFPLPQATARTRTAANINERNFFMVICLRSPLISEQAADCGDGRQRGGTTVTPARRSAGRICVMPMLQM